jgi:hypothetical protein
LQWPTVKPLNLHQLEALVQDPVLKEQLWLLSSSLYSEEKNPLWQVDALWQCVAKARP